MFFIYFVYNDIFSNYFVCNDIFSNFFAYNNMLLITLFTMTYFLITLFAMTYFLITLFTMTCFTSVCIHIKSIFTVGCTEYFFTHFICIWNKARNWLNSYQFIFQLSKGKKSGKYCVIFAPAVWSYLWNLSFFVRIPFIKSSKWFFAKQNASD